MSTIGVNPIRFLFPKVRKEVLDLLLGQPENRWHLRDIQRRTGYSVTTVRRELRGLVQAGILLQTKDGNRTYYQADKNCPISPELQGLVKKTGGLTLLLRKALEPLVPKIKAAFIYGSTAAGKVKNNSDIDVMVIGICSFKEVVGALHDVQQEVGREINPSIYPPEEFSQKMAAKQHFILTVLRQPKVFLIGEESDLKRLA